MYLANVKWILAISSILQTSFSQIPFMVKDFAAYYGKSTTVSEISCNKKESVLLVKMLAKTGHQVNVLPENIQTLPYPFPPNQILFLLDIHCKKFKSILAKAQNQTLFASPNKWLFFYTSSLITLDELTKYFQDIDIVIDSDVTFAGLSSGKFNLTKMYKTRHNFSIIVEDMGVWAKDTGLALSKNFENITARRRKNLLGTMINNCIVITHNDSLNHLTDKRDKHIDSIAKVNYVIVEQLSDIINVTLNYSIQDTWGYKNDKSEWSGMIGELTRKEADIGGTPLFLTSDRVDIIDYIAMTTPTKSKFVFREPKLSYVTNVFTLPFDTYVWLSTIALVLITGIVLYIVTKWEWHKKKYIKQKVDTTENELHPSFVEAIFLAFGALCQQGAASIPYSLPGRITAIFLFISLMFLYNSYSANIVALLQSSSTSIQTLEDLLKSRLQVGVDDTVFNRFYFPNATEPIRKAIYQQKVAPPGKPSTFMRIEDGVKLMRQGLFAFHMETGAGYKIVGETFQEAEKCGLTEIQYLQVPDPWLAIQKNSSYKELLKIGFHLIQESGLQFREVNLIYSKKPECLSRGSSFISVGLVDCYPAAVVLAGGIIIAIVVFVLETYAHYRVQIYEGRRLSLFELLGSKAVENIEHPIPYLK